MLKQEFSHYQIVEKIGAGGMGEVYRARDSRLDREVAIKVLPTDFANDEDRLRRFEQEAKATSALNHPNILTVYDIGENAGSPFIVSELLEGEELRDCLNNGTIPLRKTIDYAQQIVNGLSAAHEKGIVHRDLKPENLFITRDDRVKILDFGLAKLRQTKINGPGSEDATRRAITDPGVVMGTVSYMSPEQVRGAPIDHRSDIFSFGTILHEMITGRRAFERETMAETMSAILKEEPEELSSTSPNISPALERIVHRCLEKKAERRFQSTSDLCFALESLSAPTHSSGSSITATAAAFVDDRNTFSLSRVVPWGVAAILLVGLLIFAFLYFQRPTPDRLTSRFAISMPDKATEISKPTISPDGRTLAFTATVEGKRFIFVRPLDSTESHVLLGTEEAEYLFWSPDSKHIAFFSTGKLKRIDLTGGAAQTICDAARPLGGTWNKEGVIVFAVEAKGIQRVQASGGSPVSVLQEDDPRAKATAYPAFLPDGKHFLYSNWAATESVGELCVGSLDGSPAMSVLRTDSNALYVSPGFILFARENTLMAQAFDAAKLAVSGEPSPVLEGVVFSSNIAFSNFSVAEDGTMFYWSGSATDRQLAWFDRTGKQLSTVGPKGSFSNIKLSPDEKKVIVQDAGNLWQVDLDRGIVTRFTFGTGNDDDPSWSGDGKSIMFTSVRGGARNIFRRPSDGSANEELVAEIDANDSGSDWSTDGKYFVFSVLEKTTSLDLWVLPLTGDVKPYPLLQSAFAESDGKLSPDGRWIAYTSNESGTNEIYIQSFPGLGSKWQVSLSGGAQPRWSRDGKEIFYLTPDRKLMGAVVKAVTAIKTDAPQLLFQTTVSNYAAPDRYSVSGDGQRFLINSTSGDNTGQTPMTVILNWTAALKK